jgi:hypothetical protein
MNPKEVSYSHPQLPLCDTPKCCLSRPFTGIETQKYRFFVRMQESSQKKKHYPLLFITHCLYLSRQLIDNYIIL